MSVTAAADALLGHHEEGEQAELLATCQKVKGALNSSLEATFVW